MFMELLYPKKNVLRIPLAMLLVPININIQVNLGLEKWN